MHNLLHILCVQLKNYLREKYQYRYQTNEIIRLYHISITLNIILTTFLSSALCNSYLFGIIDNKNSSTAYVILYELIDIIFGFEQEGGSLFAPMNDV